MNEGGGGGMAVHCESTLRNTSVGGSICENQYLHDYVLSVPTAAAYQD